MDLVISLWPRISSEVIEIREWCEEYTPEAELVYATINDDLKSKSSWMSVAWEKLTTVPKVTDRYFVWGLRATSKEEAVLIKLRFG